MFRKVLCLAAVAAVGLATQAQAATTGAEVVGLKGKVLVSDANKVTAAVNKSALRPGARVLAAANSSARIKYADGCIVNVAPNSASTIAAKSPCAAGLVTSANAMQLGEFATTQVIMTGLGIVFLAGVIEANNEDDDFDLPTSP